MRPLRQWSVWEPRVHKSPGTCEDGSPGSPSTWLLATTHLLPACPVSPQAGARPGPPWPLRPLTYSQLVQCLRKQGRTLGHHGHSDHSPTPSLSSVSASRGAPWATMATRFPSASILHQSAELRNRFRSMFPDTRAGAPTETHLLQATPWMVYRRASIRGGASPSSFGGGLGSSPLPPSRSGLVAVRGADTGLRAPPGLSYFCAPSPSEDLASSLFSSAAAR